MEFDTLDAESAHGDSSWGENPFSGPTTKASGARVGSCERRGGALRIRVTKEGAVGKRVHSAMGESWWSVGK